MAYLGSTSELLETNGKPVSVRVILLCPRQPDQRSCDPLEALLEQRPVVQHQRSLGDVYAAVGVDADQVVVERRVVDLRESDTVSDDRLAEQLIGIGHDVGCVQQMIIRQVADRTSVIVGGKDAVPK
jgi:hypothetical protein